MFSFRIFLEISLRPKKFILFWIVNAHFRLKTGNIEAGTFKINGLEDIMTAFSLDAARLAQMSAGGKVQFEAIDPFSAHNELRLAESRFQRTHAEPC